MVETVSRRIMVAIIRRCLETKRRASVGPQGTEYQHKHWRREFAMRFEQKLKKWR